MTTLLYGVYVPAAGPPVVSIYFLFIYIYI